MRSSFFPTVDVQPGVRVHLQRTLSLLTHAGKIFFNLQKIFPDEPVTAKEIFVKNDLKSFEKDVMKENCI